MKIKKLSELSELTNLRNFTLITLMSLLLFTPLRAQVTIGDETLPQDFSVLELISNNTKGLRLPQMSTAQRDAMEATDEFQAEKTGLAMGLQIFNTRTKCVEYWNGSIWIGLCDDESKIPCELLNAGTITTNAERPIICDAEGYPEFYQNTIQLSSDGTPGGTWTSSDPAVATVSPTTGLVTGVTLGATIITYTVTGECSKNTDFYVYVGCGAWIGEGEWLTVMCHNLGADETLDPFLSIPHDPNGTGGTLGSMYQWGRASDGHENPFSTVVQAIATDETATSPLQVVGAYINPTPYNYWASSGLTQGLWGENDINTWSQYRGPNEPCPTGWVTMPHVLLNRLVAWNPVRRPWSGSRAGYIGEALPIPKSLIRDRGYAFSNVDFGYMWTSRAYDEGGTTLEHAYIWNYSLNINWIKPLSYGLPVRCVKCR